MRIESLVNIDFLTKGIVARAALPFITFAGILLTNYCVFMVVPNERVMGPVQRIFYFHVGSVMAAYAMIAVLFTGSCFYLVTKKLEWDMLAEASASVGYVFSSVVLASGMIWGHSAWNTWWNWEPRLVSFLLLWLVLFSYIILRSFSEGHVRQRNFAAVLGIIASAYVPIVIVSIKFLDRTQQLHPQVAAEQGLRDMRFVYTLILAIMSLVLFSLWLLLLKVSNLVLRRELRELLPDINATL